MSEKAPSAGETAPFIEELKDLHARYTAAFALREPNAPDLDPESERKREGEEARLGDQFTEEACDIALRAFSRNATSNWITLYTSEPKGTIPGSRHYHLPLGSEYRLRIYRKIYPAHSLNGRMITDEQWTLTISANEQIPRDPFTFQGYSLTFDLRSDDPAVLNIKPERFQEKVFFLSNAVRAFKSKRKL